MRQKKLARQKASGVVPKGQRLPEVHYFNNVRIMPGIQTGTDCKPLPKWKDLPEKIKEEARFRRAIYNAQIDNMDENIGRIVDKLKAEGVYENTWFSLSRTMVAPGRWVFLAPILRAESMTTQQENGAMVSSPEGELGRKVRGPIRIG